MLQRQTGKQTQYEIFITLTVLFFFSFFPFLVIYQSLPSPRRTVEYVLLVQEQLKVQSYEFAQHLRKESVIHTHIWRKKIRTKV